MKPNRELIEKQCELRAGAETIAKLTIVALYCVCVLLLFFFFFFLYFLLNITSGLCLLEMIN